MFKVISEDVAAFHALLEENAATSIEAEQNCLRFDIVRSDGVDDVLLYELYRDRGAFDAHLASSHYRAFDEATRDYVLEKTVMTGSARERDKRA